MNCEIGGLDCRVLQQIIEHVSIKKEVYTCNTYYVMHWFM